MIRGTTPTYKFGVPFDIESVDVLYVTFEQNGRVVIERDLDSCEIGDKEIKVHLTQAETLKFTAGQLVTMQIRARFNTGKATASDLMTTDVHRVLRGGVI